MNISKFFRTALAITTLFVGFTQAAKADIVTYTGNSAGGPLVDLSPFGFPGSAPYSTLEFTVGTDGLYTFQTTATYDSVIVLYENYFNDADATENFLTGNDDDVSLTTSAFAWDLTSGTHYTLVITGYESEEYGYWSTTIGGPGIITAVPEPSTWLMLAFGLAAVTYAQRRKSLR